MVSRICVLIGCAVIAGCVTAPVPRTVGPAGAVRRAEDARARARKVRDPIGSAEIAWVAGNDRAYAKARLDAAISERPDDPSALLRRGLLALTELDLAQARRSLTTVIARAPGSPEASTALMVLHARRRELEPAAPSLIREIVASGLADSARTADPLHRALATALLIDLDVEDAAQTARTGGWLPTARIVGPLGPAHDRVLKARVPLEDAVDWRTRPRYRGVTAPIRTVDADGFRLPIAADGQRGSYLVQLFFRTEKAQPSLLQARLSGFGRVKIDGFTVLERDPAAAYPPALLGRRVKLKAGWHRLTALVTAGGRDKLAVSLLDKNGRPVATEVRAAPPQGPLVIGAPDLGPTAVAAFGTGHPYWLADPNADDPERDLFGRLVAASAALTPWLGDVEMARVYLFGLERTVPTSAAAFATLAQLATRSYLPANIAQARLRKALALDPSHVGVLHQLARRTRDEDPTRALELIERAATLAPKAYHPHALMFRLHRARDWNAEAVKSLRRAAELGAPARVLVDGASYLRNLGRIDEAKALEAQAIARSTQGERGLRVRAAVRRGDLAGAMKLSAGDGASLPRARWLLVQGKLEQAAQAAQELLRQDPLSAGASRTLALARAGQGRYEAARAQLLALRARGMTSPAQEALLQTWGGPALAEPKAGSVLHKLLAFNPLVLIAPQAASRQPRGLDATDRWAGHGRVQLLDRLVDRVLPDGSAITMHHDIVRLQTKEATDQAGEINLPADALPIRLRTLKPSGFTVDVDRHPGKPDLSFSALTPGDAVEQQWVSVQSPATPWGGYHRRFFFRSTGPLVRSELVVIVPRGTEVVHFSYHGAPTPTVQQDGDQVIYHWRANDVAPLVIEPRSPHPTEFVPFVVVTIGVDRATALETRSQQTRSVARSSYGISTIAGQVAAAEGTPKKKVEAVFRWLAGQISHGPRRDPVQVLARGRGDRTGLLAAMLASIGISAEVVRARSGQAPIVAPSYPDLSDFQETLVRITLPPDASDRTEVLWAEMDRASPWLGRLAPRFRNGHYLVRTARGELSVRPIHDHDLARWALTSDIRLRVNEAGDALGGLSVELVGTYAGDLARAMASARAEDRDRQLQQWVSSLMPSARLHNVSIERRTSPRGPFVMTASVSVPNFMDLDRSHLVAERFFSAPVLGPLLGQPSLQAYLQTARRSAPLLIVPTLEDSRVEIRFPSSVAEPIEGPRSFVRTTDFGRFEQRFEWNDEDRIATLNRSWAMPLQRIEPRAFPAFRDNAHNILQGMRNRLIVPLPTTLSLPGASR